MKKQIPSLNGIRAISIMMVIGHHFQINHFLNLHNPFINYASLLLFDGALGVNIFFIISGFLITTLLIQEKERTGNISFRNFYIRRTIRIFPAYYFLLFVYYLLQLLGYLHFSEENWLVNITYTKQFFHGPDWLTGHLWSLSVEEVFYLFWPVIFVYSKNKSVKIISVLILLIVVLRVLYYNYPLPGFSSTIISTGDALLMGCLFAINNDKIAGFVTKFKRFIIVPFLFLPLSILVYDYLYHLMTSVQMTPTKAYMVFHIFSPICFGLFGSLGLFTNLFICLILIYSINVKGLLFKFLNLRIMEYIGTLSYSIYLWQQLFTDDRTYLHKFPIFLIITFIFLSALFSYYVIEKPFLRLKGRFQQLKQHNNIVA